MVYSAGTGGWHVGNLADRQMRAAAQRRGIQMPILARHPCHRPLPSAAHPYLRHRNLGSDDPGAAFYRLQRRCIAIRLPRAGGVQLPGESAQRRWIHLVVSGHV